MLDEDSTAELYPQTTRKILLQSLSTYRMIQSFVLRDTESLARQSRRGKYLASSISQGA